MTSPDDKEMKSFNMLNMNQLNKKNVKLMANYGTTINALTNAMIHQKNKTLKMVAVKHHLLKQ